MANTKSYSSRLRTLAEDHQAAITRLSEVEREALRAGADALDRLAQTCGTCQHADTENAMGGWVFCVACSSDRGDDRYKFPFAYRPVPLDERCKGWTAKEPEA